MRSNVTCFHLILPKELSWRSTWPRCQILLTIYGCHVGTQGRGDQAQPWSTSGASRAGQGVTRVLFASLLSLPETLEIIKSVHVHKKPWSHHKKHLGLLIAGKSRSICDNRQLGQLCLQPKLNITYGLPMPSDLPRSQWVTYEKCEDVCQITMCVLTEVTFEWFDRLPRKSLEKLYVCWTSRD